jgi:3',5'-cyclic AMP phosphodiesterase CpdA
LSRIVVHLSDLHFGRVQPALVESLVDTVRAVAPDVLVVTGDLTQRARPSEFLQARVFLERLPFPQVVIPGNHDIPLYNVYGRFVRRLDRFLRYITDDLEPAYLDPEIAVFGVNTARSLTWKGGRINAVQLSRLRERMCALPAGALKVVATHHPLDLPEGFSDRDLLPAARRHFEKLVECGADLLLSGHLHVTHAATGVRRHRVGGHAALFIHAGTATSTRLRGAVNAFNTIRIDGRGVRIEHWLWDEAHGSFGASQVLEFRKTPDGWIPGSAIQSSIQEPL